MKNYRPTLLLEKDTKKTDTNDGGSGSRWYIWAIVAAVVIVGLYLIFNLFSSTDSSVVSVHFSTIPKNAKIILNGEYIGNTPFEIDLIDGNNYDLKLEHDGYFAIEETITVTKSSSSFARVFEKSNKEIPITSNPDGVKVYVNDKYIGETPIMLNSDIAGVAQVKAEKTGYTTIELVHDFDLKKELFIKLEQTMFVVQIDSIPSDAELFVDNRHMGRTPISTSLTFGTHQIRLAKDGFDIVEKTIDIQDDLLNLMYSLDKQGLFIDGAIGDISVPGVDVFLYSFVNDKISEIKNQLILPSTTPISVDQDMVLTYLTLGDETPDKVIFVGKREGISAALEVVSFNRVGNSNTEITLSFPEVSQKDVFGQSIERIDWISLFAEESIDTGDIKNNPKYFVTNDGMLINRDDLENQYLIGRNLDKVIISKNEQHLATKSMSKITFFDNVSGATIGETTANDVIFSDGNIAIVQNTNELVAISLPSMQSVVINGIKNPTKVYSIGSNILAIESIGKKFQLYDMTKNSVVEWENLLSKHSWADGWVQSGMINRNIAGKDMVVMIGKIYGLKAVLHVDNGVVSLMNIWIEGDSMRENQIPRH